MLAQINNLSPTLESRSAQALQNAGGSAFVSYWFQKWWLSFRVHFRYNVMQTHKNARGSESL